MASNREERNRFLGFPVGPDPRHGEREEQRVMGIPADVFDDVNLDGLRWLAHPVREYRRWAAAVGWVHTPLTTTSSSSLRPPTTPDRRL